MSILEPLVGRIVDLDGRRKGWKRLDGVGQGF
jgi:hypothetical protein